MCSKNSVIFLTLILLFSFTLTSKLKSSSKTFLREIVEEVTSEAFCFLNHNGTVYNLNSLKNSTADYKIASDNYVVNFNICKNAINACGNKTSYATWRDITNPQDCSSLAGPELVVSKWSILSTIKLFY
jgi:hypothetical protein